MGQQPGFREKYFGRRTRCFAEKSRRMTGQMTAEPPAKKPSKIKGQKGGRGTEVLYEGHQRIPPSGPRWQVLSAGGRRRTAGRRSASPSATHTHTPAFSAVTAGGAQIHSGVIIRLRSTSSALISSFAPSFYRSLRITEAERAAQQTSFPADQTVNARARPPFRRR